VFNSAGINLSVEGITPHSVASRRGFLRTSMSLAGGVGIAGLAGLQQANAGQVGEKPMGTAVIQIWMGGGPSQYETYDMKPAAPAEIRGPFKPIGTSVPGLQICELLPQQAKLMDHFSVIRSLTHDTNNHHAASHWMQSGHFGPSAKEQPDQTRPSIGSVVSATRGPNQTGSFSNVLIAPDPLTEATLLWNFRSAYLGVNHEPMRVKAARVGKVVAGEHYFNDLIGQPQFETPAIDLLPGISVDRLVDRRSLLQQIDGAVHKLARRTARYSTLRQQAFELISTQRTRNAFDLTRESPKLRQRYGDNVWGQGALLARRLVEAGVTFVTLNLDAYQLAWDTHNYQEREFKKMLPVYDQMLTALIEDLIDRGRYDQVLVLVVGEFGRTSKINANAGRDHWGKAGVALVGGAGIQGGVVVGATDARGEYPIDRPVTPGDLLATVYHVLGIDPRHEFHDEFGRPLPILSQGRAVHELLV